MRIFTALALVAALVSPSFAADTLDVAEAKKRGVPVEVVELEHAKQSNAELESKIADLNQQIAKLKKQLAEAQASQKAAKDRLANLSPGERKQLDVANASDADIQKAVKEHRVVNGMTVEQMKKGFSGQNDRVVLKSDSGDRQDYVISTTIFSPAVTGTGMSYTASSNQDLYVVTVENGKVVFWSRP